MELLRTAPLTPPLLLEIDGEEKKNPSEEVTATFQKLEDRRSPPRRRERREPRVELLIDENLGWSPRANCAK